MRNFRLYIAKHLQKGECDARGGYGYMAQSFIKAFFFPWRSRVYGYTLPLGGARGILRITLLPSKRSQSFYRGNGFSRMPTGQVFAFTPPSTDPGDTLDMLAIRRSRTLAPDTDDEDWELSLNC